MLHLDDRAAQVYADMHADLEAERVGHRVPVRRNKTRNRSIRFALTRLRRRLNNWGTRLHECAAKAIMRMSTEPR